MKIEQLIVQYLYSSKNVTLQDIGTFILSPDAVISFENDKDVALPENSITFEYNKKALQDEALINFIVEHTHKIKPLAASDLESYTILGKQFLNIGKPFILEGIGTLQKNQLGIYEFTQGYFVHTRLSSTHAPLKEKDEEKISFTTPAKEDNNKKMILTVAVIFIVLGAAALFYFLRKDKEHPVVQTKVAVSDSTVAKKDSIKQPVPVPEASVKPIATNPDSTTFKIIIRDYTDRATAEKLLAKFTSFGHKLTLYSKDSSHYQLAIPFTSPLSDTVHARDSLRILFGGKAYVQVN